jgi:DNA repair protein RAD50
MSLQSQISDAESKIDATQTLPSDLRALQADLKENVERLEKLRADAQAAQYEEKLVEKTAQTRELDAKRETLNSEFRSLSLQADSRARLDLKRAEVRTKKAEVENRLVLHFV